jgi:protein-disulfide isomerase
LDRRDFLAGGVACLLPVTPFAAQAREAEGDPADWAALPEGLDPDDVPGLSWFGSGPKAIEIFDYNCAYCRAAFLALDKKLRKPGALRLGLIDSPQLSIGSIQAAKLRQAALILYGPAKAYAFHRRIFAQRGAIDGETGLAAARALKFDVEKLTETADSDAVRDILIAQAHFLNKAGAQATPSFFLGGKLVSGWPGPANFDALLKQSG